MKTCFNSIFWQRRPWVDSLGWDGWGINILINPFCVCHYTDLCSCFCHVAPKAASIKHSVYWLLNQQIVRSTVQLLFLKQLVLPFADILNLLFISVRGECSIIKMWDCVMFAKLIWYKQEACFTHIWPQDHTVSHKTLQDSYCDPPPVYTGCVWVPSALWNVSI